MARGGGGGEETYQPQVMPEDLPRKVVPRMEPVPVAQEFGAAAGAIDQKYRADSTAWAGDQLSKIRVQAMQNLQAQKDALQPGQDPGNFSENFLNSLDKQTEEVSEQASSNPYAHQMLTKGLNQFRDTMALHTMEYEAQQRVAYRRDSAVNNVDSQLAMIEAHPELGPQVGAEFTDRMNTMGGDPSARELLKRQNYEKIAIAETNGYARLDPVGVIHALNDPANAPADMKGALLGLNDAQRETLRQRANNNLSKPVYDSLTDEDLAGAQLKLNKVRDIIDPQHAYTLQRAIDAQVKEKQNDQKQDILDRFQDSLTAGTYGLPNANSVTRAEVEIAFPKDAQRHWDLLQGVIHAGALAQNMNKMTPEEAAKQRDALYPAQGGPEAANKIKAYEIAANAFDQSMKARQADPAQFVIDNGHGWHGLDFGKPQDLLQELRWRANTQDGVSQQVGLPVPLLSKSEQKQFTAMLSSQPPVNRMGTLQALRQTMPNDEAYTSILRQIAPGSPLTAIAGATADRPQSGQLPTWWSAKFVDQTPTGQRILEGEQILKAKDEKGIPTKTGMPADKDLMPAFMAQAGGAYSNLFRGRPETQENTYAAYKAYYAAEASTQGGLNGIINPTIAARAARAVLGFTTEYNGSNVVVPQGMDPTKFPGLMDRATARALKDGGYSDKDIEAFQAAPLRELGDMLGTGVFTFVNANGEAMRSKDNKRPIRIDLNQQYAIPSAAPPEEEPQEPGWRLRPEVRK